MVRQSTATNPAFQAEGGDNLAGTSRENPNSVPAPVIHPAAYDPKDRTDPLHLHPNESPSRDCVWKDLKKRFSQQDVFRIAEIHSEIHQTKQGTSSINDYFTQLKLLWDEMLVLRPVPACECSPSCTCGSKLSEKVRVHLENDMLSAFLIGLNENFTNTKNQIMLMKPLPDVGEAFAMVSQQERQATIGPNTLGDGLTGASAFLTRSDNNSRRPFSTQKQKPVCSYCGYTGHTVEKCYEKHGYPPGWKPRNRSMGSANQQERNNSNPIKMSPQVNAIAANFIPDASLEGKTTDPSNKLTDSEPLWIIDSGATHHIVCNVLLLQNPKKVHGVHVDLPNGHHAQVSHIGTIHLSADLVLQNLNAY
nr:uncharacterized protein LOC109157055 [Ipomoea batatas]